LFYRHLSLTLTWNWRVQVDLEKPLTAQNYRDLGFGSGLTPMDAIVPFVACGDLSGYDADASYPLDLDERGAEGASADAKPGAKYEYRAPPQPPINPPYKEYLDRKHAGEAEG